MASTSTACQKCPQPARNGALAALAIAFGAYNMDSIDHVGGY